MKKVNDISTMYKNLTLVVHLKKYLIPQRPAYPTIYTLQYTNFLRSQNPGKGLMNEEFNSIVKQKLK